MKTMRKVIDWIADLVFPNRCAFCGEFIAWNKLACDKCVGELEEVDFCPKCGKHHCECEKRSFSYDGCTIAYPYSGIVRKGVLALKYHNGFNTAKYLAPILSERLKTFGFLNEADLITAVPMTNQRRRVTGYNQSEYIAKCISKQIGLSCSFNLLGKRHTAPIQHELSAEERVKAAKGAYFTLDDHADINGKIIILCDDIITTGSTLSECAKVLKSAGAKKVYCAVAAGADYDPQ